MRANLYSNSKAKEKEKEKEFISTHILNKNGEFNSTNDKTISHLIEYGNNLKKESNSPNINSNVDFLISKQTDNKYSKKPNFVSPSNNNDSNIKPFFEKKRVLPIDKNINRIEYESIYKYELDSAIPEEIGYSGANTILPPITNNNPKKENNYNRENKNNFDKQSRLNNLMKFNNFNTNISNLNNISAAIGMGNNNAFFGNNLNNNNINNNIGNRERENFEIKKRNFFDEEKNIFGNIKENLQRDIETKQNYVIKNREYSMNDKDLARNHHLKLNNLRDNKFSKENNYGIKENLNMNLKNINNYSNFYNPVLTNVRNINNELFNKENNVKPKNFPNNNYNFHIDDKQVFKNSKKKWDFDINGLNNNGYENKRESHYINAEAGNVLSYADSNFIPNYNSRRKILRGINDNKDNNNNSSAKKDTSDLNAININNIVSSNINSTVEVNFNSRRQHVLNKIAV